MRKFNLKGKVAEKLKGLEAATAVSGETGQEQAKTEKQAPEYGGLHYVWRTDVGRIRKNNQDSVIIGNGLFGVADGMGGHNGGEIASAGLRDGLIRETEGEDPSAELLEAAVKKVNLELWEQQEKDASLTGMGTTLTVLWPAEEEMIIGQVGDSRAYLLRDGILKQVTDDHSMVADMVRRGVLTEEQAACHPMRNYITRAVGTDDTIEVDLSSMNRMNGDRWLICSDGLYGQIGKTELLELTKIDDLDEAADRMLQTALENGGKDNISFILMQDHSTMPESGNPDSKDDGTETAEKEKQEGETAQ